MEIIAFYLNPVQIITGCHRFSFIEALNIRCHIIVFTFRKAKLRPKNPIIKGKTGKVLTVTRKLIFIFSNGVQRVNQLGIFILLTHTVHLFTFRQCK